MLFLFRSVANTELKEATAKIEKAKAEGRLKEFAQGPSLLYALLTHPDMTPEMVQGVILDLFVAGVESVRMYMICISKIHMNCSTFCKQKRLDAQIF